jgi:DNA primase
MVYFQDERFLCHQCNAHGDAISWIMMSEGLSFVQAEDSQQPRA